MTTATPIAEAFETWARSQNWICDRNSFGEYIYETARDGWDAYRAATERAAKLCDAHAATLTSVGIRGRETAEECAAAIRASGGMGAES